MSEGPNARGVKDCCDGDCTVDGTGRGGVGECGWGMGSYPPGPSLLGHSLAKLKATKAASTYLSEF